LGFQAPPISQDNVAIGKGGKVLFADVARMIEYRIMKRRRK